MNVLEIMNLTGIAILPLLLCNWTWEKWTRRMRRAVPDSLIHARAREECRKYRWPGAMCWPIFLIGVIPDYQTDSGWLLLFHLASTVAGISLTRDDIRELRRQLAEDEDDWWNRAKRGVRRAWASAKQKAASLTPSPVAPWTAGA